MDPVKKIRRVIGHPDALRIFCVFIIAQVLYSTNFR